MSEKDFAVSSVGLPQVGKVSNKPRYLIQMNHVASVKGKPLVNFVALDKPGFEIGFIAVKGFYCDKSEDEIVSSFTDLVNTTPKDQIQDLLLPDHRIHVIRSLVFNAHKPSTLPTP